MHVVSITVVNSKKTRRKLHTLYLKYVVIVYRYKSNLCNVYPGMSKTVDTAGVRNYQRTLRVYFYRRRCISNVLHLGRKDLCCKL